MEKPKFFYHKYVRGYPEWNNTKSLNKFQIIVDHTDYFIPLDNDKIRLYWSHLTPEQNEEVAKIVNADPKPLANGGWNKFHKIIFISHYQMENWINKYNIPRSHCTVMKYALEPIELQKKPKDKIVLVHQSSPQRGLSLLVDVFERLCAEYDNIELKVHSSYKIYDDENDFLKIFNEKQIEYEKSDLYQRLEQHPKINNIGFVSNEELKKSLASSHIFAYPNIMPETFCLSLLEAMSAGCLCVHSSLGCLGGCYAALVNTRTNLRSRQHTPPVPLSN
jgi:glycosyltransferase involved in cell wall biosynthesis